MELARKMEDQDKLYRYNGVLYPVIMSPEENLRALEDLDARPDDIMLVAYPKCGKFQNGVQDFQMKGKKADNLGGNV